MTKTSVITVLLFFVAAGLFALAAGRSRKAFERLSDSFIGATLARMTIMHGALPPKARNIAALMGFVVAALALFVAFYR